jgi:hypothetical protein
MFRPAIHCLLITAMLGASLPAQAALMPTESAFASEAATLSSSHTEIQRFLARKEVTEQLVRMGVSPQLAQERVASLTPDEAQRMANRIKEQPAGAGDVIGLAFTLFIILLVTDILGLTKVFPFTRSLRH